MRCLLFGQSTGAHNYGQIQLRAQMQADNLKTAYMHLTNYAVNKHNEGTAGSDDATGSACAAIPVTKWSFAAFK